MHRHTPPLSQEAWPSSGGSLGGAAVWLLSYYGAPVRSGKLLWEGRYLGSLDCFLRGAASDAAAALAWLGSLICSSVDNVTALIHVALHLEFLALSQPSSNKI